jgi:3-phosphoshikimate 1-carboxyvinyltransferase
MTVSMMRSSGVIVDTRENGFLVHKGCYSKSQSNVLEGDWSAAAFWYALMAIKQSGEIRIKALMDNSLQGDSHCSELFSFIGVKTKFEAEFACLSYSKSHPPQKDFDFFNTPDLAIPFAVCCALIGKETKLTGLNNLNFKESRRLDALCEFLQSANVSFETDGISMLRIIPSAINVNLILNTYSDHRLAMAFSLAAAAGCKVAVNNPDCVKKSYPDFWNQLKNIGFNLSFTG